MKLLENYIKAVEELEEYFNIKNLSCYPIEIRDDFFNLLDNKELIGFADNEEDLENESGDYYQEEVCTLNEKEELTLVLIDSCTGEGKYWIIFKNKNKREYE